MNLSFHRRLNFSDVALYAVTPETTDKDFLIKKTKQILEGGVDAVQLRSRSLSDKELFELGRQIKELCCQFGALFIVNNRVDLASVLDADGVHIGHEDLPIVKVRELLGHRKILGVSTHSLPEALAAQKQGADYVSCGPLWSTPTKPEYKPVGLGLIGLYNAALQIPYVAIGGIDLKNINQVVEAGAKTVAVVRSLFDSENPANAAKQILEKVKLNRIKVII